MFDGRRRRVSRAHLRQRLLLVRVLPLRRRVSKATAPAAAADGREKDAAKRGAEEAVDDEIARRIDDNQ